MDLKLAKVAGKKPKKGTMRIVSHGAPGSGGGYRIRASIEVIKSDPSVPAGELCIDALATIGLVECACSMNVSGKDGTIITLPGLEGVKIRSTKGVAVHKAMGGSTNVFF